MSKRHSIPIESEVFDLLQTEHIEDGPEYEVYRCYTGTGHQQETQSFIVYDVVGHQYYLHPTAISALEHCQEIARGIKNG